MILLSDNDILLKLAVCNLLDEALAVLNARRAAKVPDTFFSIFLRRPATAEPLLRRKR